MKKIIFKNKKLVLFASVLAIALVGIISYKAIFKRKEVDIEKLLKTESYAYLPKEAKNYIEKIYKQSGEVILTERNKKENTPYLNPQYVDYLVSSKEENITGEIPFPMVVDYSTRDDFKSVSLPSRYDLRSDNEKNFVTPVRDQGGLGICWTFASAGAMESYMLKQADQTYTSSSKLISERQMDYATSKDGITDYKSEYVSFINRTLGSGGNFYISSILLANGVSLYDYNSFKEFDDTDLTRMELYDSISYDKSLYEVTSTINFPRSLYRESTSILTPEEAETRNNYLNEVKQNIMKNGAAYVATYVDKSCRYTDSNLNNVVIDDYACNIGGGHAMEIIGWDDDMEYSYCADTKTHNSDTSGCKNVVKGKGVWILKNSWGKDMQYPYLTYDSMYTFIGFINEVKSAADKDWDNNYILGSQSELTKNVVYSFSDTKIKDEENLKKIKFITETSNSTCTVEVNGKNTSGKFTKTTALPGLVTFNIDKNIIVDKDSKFEITCADGYIDKVSIFTSNSDNTPYISMDKYNNKTISDLKVRLYSETKNIPSGTTLTYKVYNSNNEDVTNKFTITNNIVAENNINTLVNISRELDSGTYRIDVIYNSNVISSTNINFAKMEGTGTQSDPYIITNPTQLNQIRDDLDAYYELANDIDLTEYTNEGGILSLESSSCPQGFGWQAIDGFSGSIDGKGHTIKGLKQRNRLKCESHTEWHNKNNGFIRSAYGNVTIKNLVLDNFDITCQKDNCGILISEYFANNNDSNDKNEYTATFENIVTKNGQVAGYCEGSCRYIYGGGLIGYTESTYGNVNFSNIYIGHSIDPDRFSNISYLSDKLFANHLNIKNIQFAPSKIIGNTNSVKRAYLLSNSVHATNYDTENYYTNVKNILSTIPVVNMDTNVFGTIWGGGEQLTISGVNALKPQNNKLTYRFDEEADSQVSNINLYDEDQLVELTKRENYSSWENFDQNWKIETINGVPRIPVLKFMNFEYTNIPNITINQQLNEKYNIYDYLTPKTDSAKRITYNSNDESIIEMDSDGYIIPKASGNTTIHIASYYDGYIKDVPIVVNYTPHYDIVFDANGGTGTMEKLELAANQPGILSGNQFERDRYEFAGWNTKADGTGKSYSDLGEFEGANDKEVITLYAQWLGEEVVITFDANGGTVTPDRKIARYGGTYGDLPIPTREGYAFSDWVADYICVDSRDEISIGHNLKAEWEENYYNILYDANGGTLIKGYSGTGVMSDTSIIKMAMNDDPHPLLGKVFEKQGYILKEWNTKADGSGTSYTPEQVIKLSNVENSMLKLYAIWRSAVQHTITFHSNIGNNTTTTQNVYDSEPTLLNKNTFNAEGYKFAGWNTASDGSGTSYSDEQNVTLTQNLDLYAQWTPIKYTIKFNSNSGSGEMNDLIVDYDKEVTLTKNVFGKEHYNFKGWATTPNGEPTYTDEQKVSNLTTEDEKVITLYAVWQEMDKHTITFKKNDGTEQSVTQFVYDKIATNLRKNTFTRTGYKFIGWNTASDGSRSTYTDEQSITITENLTLYAQWTPIKYTIKFNSNGGTGEMNDLVVEYDKEVTLTKNAFKKEGYRFTGWATTTDGEVVYTNTQKIKNLTTEEKTINLYAVWEEVEFNINDYVVEEDTITEISEETTLEEYLTKFEVGVGYRIDVYKGETKLTNEDLIGTGSIVKIYKNDNLLFQYTNIVYGDVNQDGKVTSSDVRKIANSIIGSGDLTEIENQAAEVTNDGNVSSSDVRRIANYIIGASGYEVLRKES